MNVDIENDSEEFHFRPIETLNEESYYQNIFILYISGLQIASISIVLMFFSYTHYIGAIFAIFLLITSCAILINLINGKRQEAYLCWSFKNKKVTIFLRLIYIIVFVFSILFLFIRIYNVIEDKRLIEFPKTCEPLNGCAQVSLNNNHRADEVNSNHIFTISRTDNVVNSLHSIIESCINSEFQSTIDLTLKDFHSSK